MSNIRSLCLALIYGAIVGIAAGIIFVSIFPQIVVFTREIPFSDVPLIFVRNCLAVTLITFGGVANCLIEVRVWRRTKLSNWLNRSVDPWYKLIKRFSSSFEKLGKFYRSLYLGLFAFPIMSIFVIIFLVGFYFTIFVSKLGIDGLFIFAKSLPYIFLEMSVYFYGAYLALGIGTKLEPYVEKKNLKLFVEEGRKSLKNVRVWKALLVLYILLFISAILEQTFSSL